MEITSAEFVISNTDVKKCPAGIFPEYAFIGRSNVGKSSLINMLTSRKGLAMTSSTPGKTMLINLNNTYNKVESTYRYSDYSYIRLKNMEIGYTFPKKWLSEAHISNLQVYMNGNNLLTFWKGDKRVDPETGGVGSYPIVRTYTLGLRVSF